MTRRTERPASPAGRSARETAPDDDARFAEWVQRLRSTHRAVAFTCRYRLSEPAYAEPVAVRVVAGLLARPTVFRYFGLPFSGRIATLAENLIADAEAGRPPAPVAWSDLESRVLSLPDHHRDVLVSVCLDGDDVDTLADRLGCPTAEATSRRAALLAYMRDVVACDPTATPDDGG